MLSPKSSRRLSSFALLLLFVAVEMQLAVALQPELESLTDVLADQAAIPGPFSPESPEELANMEEELANVEGEREQAATGVITADNEDELTEGEQALIAAEPESQPDVFLPMDSRSSQVQTLVAQFMDEYQDEVGRTALKASVLQVLKAQRTEPREELQEIEIGGGGEDDAVEIVERDMTQLMRVFLLVNYGFQTSMLDAKRPYVSVLRLTMDCVNGTSATTTDTEPELECDILEHLDLPRTNGSALDVDPAIQREIARAAPATFLQNHTLRVHYDAVEMQDLALDATEAPDDYETMTYVRYRVANSDDTFSAQDCMVVVQQTRGIQTLMYTDPVCYDGSSESVALSAFEYTKNNLPMGALIFAAVCGAVVALVLVVRHRRSHQRLGYAYVRSKAPSHVPSQTAATGGTTYGEPATAC
ncbi:hypothetical protein BBJ28_00021998 [Nothophytophthora sp. Chile5]|nr:hypothetical protein BBJ28_00021998 [Nothophytophthora sp. Chile5]